MQLYFTDQTETTTANNHEVRSGFLFFTLLNRHIQRNTQRAASFNYTL